ncbi:MAG TPA: crossover junction endodeoxyribonuclease RuvC [Anaerohalosphaeraceae bacterium]|nr:crossover junction endodeoxyribonuclease RuvC [Phycisphaerae bacterium]HOK96229.1 crossover junction endodeoxyribonuclease RuvC [Anaerohalosphaeraceae bacterium]HOL32436.1 crossover junction endodeoxyribonuclease RuvC [Anaerohalosphaeraceae bacterium]HOM75529.1 crossover junction endodeoxyribonuclease RuvC [Anaerohalosphaeraceae bacterium]HPC64734.1 crossover junction endodeoxyribonuclease RuvC [Anaerohalosphaeraceae bacterium]
MKILGIDPGLQVCGYAVVERKRLDTRLVEAGVFRTDGRAELEKRLNQIAADIGQILQAHRPQIVAVEQLYAHYKHPQTAILMGHARGVILQKAAESGASVKNFSATRIKKSLTGNGRAHKGQMQRAIQTVLALPDVPKPPDVADAIAIALCCASEHQAV